MLPAMKIGRVMKCRCALRSMNGRANNRIRPIVGITKTPITSRLPGKYFKSWNKKRKYHSGLGVYVVSEGSARSSRGAPTKKAKAIKIKKINRDTTASLKSRSGKKGTPLSFACLYLSKYSLFSFSFIGYSPFFGTSLIPIRTTK